MESYYVIVSTKEYEKLQETGYLKVGPEYEGDPEEKMSEWLFQQLKKRLPSTAFNPTVPEANNAIFMFLSVEDIYLDWAKGHMLLEVKLENKHVVKFDDTDYVSVCNDIMNDSAWNYIADSESEAEAFKDASPEVVKASWEKMFDTTRAREEAYCGTWDLRAATPYISKYMVVKAKQI